MKRDHLVGPRRRRALLTLGAAVALCPAAAHAEQVTLVAVQDTTLYQHDASRSDGQGAYLFAGLNGRREPRHALLAFDVARSLPKGATVTAAALTLHVSRTQGSTTLLSVYRVAAAWGEGLSRAAGQEGRGASATQNDATWSHRQWPALTWSAPGADYASEASAELSVSGIGDYTFTSDALARDVQRFLDEPTSNFGWLLRDARGSGSSKRFDSHDNAAGSPPRLVVTFDLPAAATGACCLADGTCGIALDPGSACVGNYRGAGSTCAAGTCPELSGACCGNDAQGSCQVRKKSECDASAWRGGNTSCKASSCPVVLTPFVDDLPLPAVATPVTTKDGEDRYRIAMFQTQQKLHRDLPPTTVWGFYDGTFGGYPGPTIEARSGTQVRVTWLNDLRDASGKFLTEHPLAVDHCLHGAEDSSPRTVVHLHGGHVPAEYDGYPEATLLPGQKAEYRYPNQQRAATLWYHDHALGITRLNVMMGLAGFYLIRDHEEEKLHLPQGKYEIPIVIQDRSFNPDGSLLYPAKWQESFFGNLPVVNGKVSPRFRVDRGKYRFRLLNGSTSRVYKLSLSNGQPIVQIGNDGGLLRESFARSTLTLAPGERADIVLDFQYCDDEVTLQNSAPAPFPNGGGGSDIPQIMKFVRTAERGFVDPLPLKLSTLKQPDEADAVKTRDIVLEQADEEMCGGRMWTINGKHWNDITEKPHLGTSEVWRFINRSGVTHPMHLHSLFFQVLDRQKIELDGKYVVPVGDATPPDRPDEGWKDTVKVGPLEMVRVLAHFDDYAGRFAYHCHLLEHEDHGMMRQFEAVAVCGDGAVARGIEDCDDGNTNDRDGCPASCKFASDEPPPAEAPPAKTAASAGDPSCRCALSSAHHDWRWALLLAPLLGRLGRRAGRARRR